VIKDNNVKKKKSKAIPATGRESLNGCDRNKNFRQNKKKVA
jgi:hypothetical protein